MLHSHHLHVLLPPKYENKEDGEEKEKDTEKKEKEENKEKVIKPAISKTKVTIPINKVKPEQLSVLNPEEGVVYTFASSNKKIVTVGKKNGKLKGKKAGFWIFVTNCWYNGTI